MSNEWSRTTITNLLEAYKKEEVLYNPNEQHYHNKTIRTEAWERVLAVVVKTQEETTLVDVTKKIQSLRTQFGQEILKIEKTMNSNQVQYYPKVWWFKHFTWISEFMKTRSDQTPMSEIIKSYNEKNQTNAKGEKSAPTASTPIVLLNQTDAPESQTDEIEFEEEFDSPPRKMQKTTRTRLRSELSKDNATPHYETIEYTLIDEDHNETLTSEKSKSQFIEYQTDRHLKKIKRRSKAFGKYVTALLLDIESDEIYFELQNNLIKLIQDAAMKQQNLLKS